MFYSFVCCNILLLYANWFQLSPRCYYMHVLQFCLLQYTATICQLVSTITSVLLYACFTVLFAAIYCYYMPIGFNYHLGAIICMFYSFVCCNILLLYANWFQLSPRCYYMHVLQFCLLQYTATICQLVPTITS